MFTCLTDEHEQLIISDGYYILTRVPPPGFSSLHGGSACATAKAREGILPVRGETKRRAITVRTIHRYLYLQDMAVVN